MSEGAHKRFCDPPLESALKWVAFGVQPDMGAGTKMPIRLSVNGLAKFMTSSDSARRTLLKDFKFPFNKDGSKKPQIVRYSEARAAIRDYHEAHNNASVIVTAIEKLIKKREQNPEKDAARINDNVRALETYLKHFSNRNFVILDTPKPSYVHGEVTVTAGPDLFVEEKGKKKLIKLDFSEKKPNEETVQIMLKVMHEAAMVGGIAVAPADVIYLDITRQTQFTGKKLNKLLKKNIDAACTTIADIWPKLTQ